MTYKKKEGFLYVRGHYIASGHCSVCRVKGQRAVDEEREETKE